MLLKLAYCHLFASLIVAYWLGYLRLIGQAYYGLFAWFFVTYCRLLTATGLVICGLLARLTVTH